MLKIDENNDFQKLIFDHLIYKTEKGKGNVRLGKTLEMIE